MKYHPYDSRSPEYAAWKKMMSDKIDAYQAAQSSAGKYLFAALIVGILAGINAVILFFI